MKGKGYKLCTVCIQPESKCATCRDTGSDLTHWTPCVCGAQPEHMGEERYGLFHNQACPRYDGDHAEICDKPTKDVLND